MVKQIPDNEIYLLIKYIRVKSVLWWAAKRLSYTEDARCLKVKHVVLSHWVFRVFRYGHTRFGNQDGVKNAETPIPVPKGAKKVFGHRNTVYE